MIVSVLLAGAKIFKLARAEVHKTPHIVFNRLEIPAKILGRS
jgi:hypothetical protein